MKRLLALLLAPLLATPGLDPGAALAQVRQPASITTIPSATPQEFNILDTTGKWLPFGLADSGAFSLIVGTPHPGSASMISAHSLPNSVSAWNVPAFKFDEIPDPSFSFPDTSTHFSMLIYANSPGTGPGSYNNLFVAQGCANMVTAVAYCTGAVLAATATVGTGPNNGNFTGSNPLVTILPGVTGVHSAVGEEIDTDVHASVVQKEGLRIYDKGDANGICTTSLCAVISAAKASAATGYTFGLYFNATIVGTDSGFPITANGTLIKANTTSLQLNSGMDLSGMAGGFGSRGAIALPSNVGGNQIQWGTVGEGGMLISDATTDGGRIVFDDGKTALQFSGTTALSANSDMTVKLNPIAIAALPVCSAGLAGSQAFLNNATAAPAYHGIVALAGTAQWPVWCTYDGASYAWRY